MKIRNLLIIVFFIVMFSLLGMKVLGLGDSNYNDVKSEFVSVAQSKGLIDVEVVIGDEEHQDGYKIHYVQISSSNFSSMSSQQMFDISTALRDAVPYKISEKYKKTLFIMREYLCDGNVYRVYTSSKSIYKNGEEVFDDYKNSEDYQSAKENESKEYDVTDKNVRIICWSLAEDAVKNNLKAPSTAKFAFSSISSGVSITSKGNIYTVISYVDAQNSFGAKIRSNFKVTIEKSGSGDSAVFTVKSCVIE